MKLGEFYKPKTQQYKESNLQYIRESLDLIRAEQIRLEKMIEDELFLLPMPNPTAAKRKNHLGNSVPTLLDFEEIS